MRASFALVIKLLGETISALTRLSAQLIVHSHLEVQMDKVRVLVTTLTLAILPICLAPSAYAACSDPNNLAKAQNCIWSNSTAPSTADDGGATAMEAGVKFTANTGGYVTGIRFYKAAANTGTHTGELWTSAGTLLASATFTAETASGWQQADFATPVLIAANTTYVASYHTNTGHTSDDHNYFTSGAVDNPPLHALASGVSGGNGVYVYNAGTAFPTVNNLDSNYWVDVAFVPTLAVTPANTSIMNGSQQQFIATETFSDGSTQNVTSSVTWTSTTTSVATITSAGLATAVATGSTTIQATLGSINGSTGLTITAGIPGLAGHWTFDDGAGTTAADSSGNGHPATLVNGVTWTTGKIGSAISTNGTNQSANIPAINLSATSAVTVSMWVNRTYSTAGGHTLFEATTNYNSSTTGFGLFPDDSSCNGIQASVHGDAGYSVNCYSQPSSGVWHHLVVVYDKTQAGNNEVNLYIDGVLQTPIRNLYTNNNTNAFGNNPIYLFSRGGTQGYAAGTMDDLQIYNRSLSASEIQQIYNQGSGAALVSIALTPANPSIAKGTTRQFTATGTFSDNSTQNLTSSVTWTSTNTAVATITSAGLASSVATGSTTMQAASGSISGSTGLTVTPAVLASIAVTPANPSMAKGATQQFTATGTYSDGSTQNLTGSVTWASTNTAAATITNAGLATGVAAGSTTIQATSSSITGSTGLTVSSSSIAGLAGYWTFDEGSGTTAADASGNGHPATLVNGVTWTTGKIGGAISTNRVNQYASIPAINLSATSAVTASLWVNRTYSTAGGHALFEATPNFNNSTTGFGLFPDDPTCNGIMAGVHGDAGYSINCYSQPSSGVWHHLVVVYDKTQAGNNEVNLYIDGVLQTPKQNYLTANNTNAFGNNPIYLFSRGGTQEFAAGAIDDLQIYGRSLSASEIQQIYGQGSGAALVSLTVTPANPSIAKGATQQFTATGTFSDNSTQNLTSTVTWTSTNTGVATITSAGLASSVATGSTTIQAASGSINGSTSLTVTSAVLTSLAVTPANSSMINGATQQFTATGTFSDGGTQDMTTSVAWTSTNTAAATITATGLASAVGPGTTTIQAVSGSINGSTLLTVTTSLVYVSLYPTSVIGGASSTGTVGLSAAAPAGGAVVSLSSNNTAIATVPASVTVAAGATTATFIVATNAVAAPVSVTISATYNGPAKTADLTVTPVSSGGSGKLVQWATGDDGAASTSTTHQFSNATSGNLILVFSHWDGQTITASASDPLGNTYIPITGPVNAGTTARFQAWYAKNIIGGVPLLVTVTYSGNTASFSVVDVAEYSGLDTSAPLDAVASASGNGTSMNSGFILSTSTPNETLIGLFGNAFPATPYTAGAPFTFEQYDASTFIEDRPVTATGSYNATATSTSANGWAAFVVSFKNAFQAALTLGLNPQTVIGGNSSTGTVTLASAAPAGGAVVTLSSNSAAATVPGSVTVAAGGTTATFTITTSAVGVATVATITATYNGTATAQLTVNPPPTLVSIAVTPANPSIAKGTTQQFTATGTFSDNSTQNLTGSVTWTSTNTAVGTITSAGVATGVAAGSTTIRATSGSINGSTVLTVPSSSIAGLASYWTFDEGSGTTAADSSGNGYTAALVNGVTWTTGKIGGAISTNGVNQYANTPAIDLSTTSAVTVSAWVNRSYSASGGSVLFEATPNFNNSSTGFGLFPDESVCNGIMTGVKGDGGYTINCYSQPSSGVWHHLAAIYDKSQPGNSEVSFYVDGVLQTPTQHYLTTDNSNNFGNNQIYVFTRGGTQEFSSGMIDDFRIYKRALSTAEIQQLYGFGGGAVPPATLTLGLTTVTGGSPSTGTVTLSSTAPVGGTVVTLASGNTSAATVPASVTVAAGAITASFTVNTSPVGVTTTVVISASLSGTPSTANLSVTPPMAQLASDTFNRANAPTLGANWTPLIGGAGTNVALQVAGNRAESTAVNPGIAKEMYFGGLNWVPDQYSEVQIVAASGTGYEGPAVRMTSDDTHYACVVYTVGSGTASVQIMLDNAGIYTILATSTTATARTGDTVRCTVQGTSLTMTNRTTSTTLLTVMDSSIPSGYPGLVDSAGSSSVTNYVMTNWAGGASAASLVAKQLASDNFNRANALNLGANWHVGTGHGPEQIISQQIQPYPAGGPQPSKEHYVAAGAFPNDQWSRMQAVVQDTIGDMGAELRASDTVDNMYVADLNLTGGPGTAMTRIVKVVNGQITPLIIDQQWSAVSPGDYIRGQIQGSLISLIDETTGVLLLTTFDTQLTFGYPGISMQAVTGNPADHIADNWSGGSW